MKRSPRSLTSANACLAVSGACFAAAKTRWEFDLMDSGMRPMSDAMVVSTCHSSRVLSAVC